ncbi:hypothetical protein N7452_009705 [Penicillium brevicompactum]|uniref:Kynurenine formamidase n=1 Tax=Penicillium brevicompactum TaxID=5074 RepID=A0A9W9UCI1_PENBR|nr:hypothetical protein N7452_009705 [Penicillium brevicompactum]
MPSQSRTVAYGRVHNLQIVSVTPLASSKDGYWVIFIHGGAWRDPTVKDTAFNAAESILRDTPDLPIAGFASISYRLSAHPNHPQDPINTSPTITAMRNTPIIFGICGATLAFQAVMGAVSNHREQAFSETKENPKISVGVVSASPGPLPPPLTAQPTAIVGVAGIYDLRRLRDSHPDISAYSEFIEGAFGADELLWDGVSPAQMAGSRGVEGGWKSGRLAVLAHSKDDELVDESQLDAMEESLKQWGKLEAQIPVQELSHRDRRVRVLPISGAHDEAWERGDQLAYAIIYALEQLREMGLAPQ